MVRRVLTGALALIVMVGLVPVAEAPAVADDSPPALTCPAPLPGPRAVVQLAFMVLLRRCPDAAGAAAWETSLRDGMATETFARRIAATPEARGVVVTDAYRLVLARTPAASERAFWVDWLRPGSAHPRRHDELLAELAASAELYAAAGGDPEAFVDLLYERILGRSASAADREYWGDRLGSSVGSRRVLARTLLRLTEPLGATVTAAWREVLDARPNATNLARDVARLRSDGDRLGLSARLVGSAAFANRAQRRALVVPGRYVALGDSFVVSEGNPPFVTEGDETSCAYTTSAYPEVARTSSELVPGTLDVAACTGASVLNLYDYHEGESGETYPGQIAAIADGESPELVTLTIGGNDIGFVSIVEACLQVQVNGAGQFSPYYSRSQCDHMLDEYAPAATEALRTGIDDWGQPEAFGCDAPCTLPGAVADVVAAAPDAEVVVVGYPPFMPAVDTGCRGPLRIDGEYSPTIEWYVAPADVRRGRRVIAELNAALRDAAVAAGATYVGLGPRFAGHEVCSADPWLAGVEVDADLFPLYSSFHPNRRGGVGAAAALIDALEG